jgi:hypothetical protein
LQRDDDLVDSPLQHMRQVVEREADAVIGHPVLRKVVGADALGTVAGADLAAALGGVFGALLVLPELEQPRAEHGQGAGLVFLLRAAVGAKDNHAGRLVDDAHGGIGGVDPLPARTARALHGDFQILRIEVKVDLLRLGQHGDGDGGGVNAAAGLGDGHALHAMDATLEPELPVNVLPADEEAHLLETAALAHATAHRLDLPAVRVGIFLIKAGQLGGEQRRLLAARAGADFHDGVARVGRVGRDHGEQHRLLEDVAPARQPGQFLRGELLEGGIAGGIPGQCLGLGNFASKFLKGLMVGDQLGEFLLLARHFRGPPRIGIERRLRHLRVELVKAPLEGSDVRQSVHEGKGVEICELHQPRSAAWLKPVAMWRNSAYK